MGGGYWRLLQVEYRSPFLNLALEEALLRFTGAAKSPNTIRLWVNLNTVVLGRFQRLSLEVNMPACKRHRVQVARRLTGGGAVYHDAGNLNFSVFLPRIHPLAQGSIVRMFQVAGSAVVLGLRELGLDGKFVPPNAVQLDGRKVSGMAGAVKWGAVLVHGTLLVEADLSVLREVLDVQAAPRAMSRKSVRSVKAEVTNLRERESSIGMGEARRALRIGFEKALGIQLPDGGLMDEEDKLARQLYGEKYGRPEWNLECPP